MNIHMQENEVETFRIELHKNDYSKEVKELIIWVKQKTVA